MTLRVWWRTQRLVWSLAVKRSATLGEVLELGDCFTPDAKALWRATFRRAAFFGGDKASPRHLIIEAFEREPALSACVRALDLDVDVVRDALAASLGDEDASTDMEAMANVRADHGLWGVALLAREHLVHGTITSPKGLVSMALLFDPPLARELAAFGVDRHELVTWFSHGVTAHPPIDDDAHRGIDALDVWIDNDDYTTMDFVVATLRDDLALDDAAALAFMRIVHAQGSARVGTFARPEAIARANAVLARARLAGLPLRARVQPP